MKVVNISNHGRITIPSELRKKYGWNDGDRVIIIDDPLEGIKILPFIPDEKISGILDRKVGIEIIKDISKERNLEIEQEKTKLYRNALS